MNRRVVGLCAVSTVPQANKEEKVSLEEQERLIRERAAADGDVLVDMLIIPGFSRRYYNLYDLIEEAGRAGHDAPRRLLEHIRARDFDVLMCRYGNRMAREQSIFGEIVARVIDAGAEIFTLADGLIHAGNYRMYISMAGYAAATEVDRLVQGRKDAMQKRAARGLPVSSRVMSTHHLVRDEHGAAVELRVDPAKRRLLDDIATLLLEGVGFNSLGALLYERYGHLRPDGSPYGNALLYNWLHSPTFWGHTAQHHSGRYGTWVYDDRAVPPEGVSLYRNTHEPAYTGVLAEQIKTELRRRSELKAGQMNNAHANPFTGLVVCAGCGWRMTHAIGKRWRGYVCASNTTRFKYTPRADCDSRPRIIHFDKLQTWVDGFLRELLDSAQPLQFRFDDQDYTTRAAQLETEITSCERRIAGLLIQRADTPPASQTILTNLIQAEDRRLLVLREQRQSAARQAEQHSAERAAARAAWDAFTAVWPQFWTLPPDSVNRLLYGVFGDFKLFAHSGEIVDFKPHRR